MSSRRTALGLLAAGALVAPRRAWAQAAPVVRLGGSGTDLYIEPFLALDGGYFARAGIDAQVTSLANGGAIADAIAGGALDVGLADMIQIANAVDRGLPFAFFAGSGLYSADAPTNALCVAQAGTVHAAKDLNGQTIALVAVKSITEAAVREGLRRNGADLSTIRFFEMPYGEMAPALAHGTVGGAFIGEPFLSAAKGDVRILGRCYDAVARTFYISAWFGSRDWLARNPDLVRRVTAALYATARWADAHHDETAPILAKYAKLDLARIRAMTRTTYATSLDPKLMQPVLDIAATYHLIAKPVVATSLIATA